MRGNEKKPSEIISDFIELMKTAQEQCADAKKKCSELDSFERHEYWDHSFEFARDKSERNKLATAYQQERRKRREYKDIVDFYIRINDFVSSENNKAVLKRLNGMLSMQKHQEEYLASDRKYKGNGGECGGFDSD